MSAVLDPKPVKSAYRIQFDRERWMAAELKALTKVSAGEGLTTLEQRQTKIRELILDNGLADVVIGRPSGKTVTWRSSFRQTYGVDL